MMTELNSASKATMCQLIQYRLLVQMHLVIRRLKSRSSRYSLILLLCRQSCLLQPILSKLSVSILKLLNLSFRSYLRFTDSVYRFSPVIIETEQDSKRFHGHNERISIDNYLKIVNFYHHIMINADEKELKRPPVKDEL